MQIKVPIQKEAPGASRGSQKSGYLFRCPRNTHIKYRTGTLRQWFLPKIQVCVYAIYSYFLKPHKRYNEFWLTRIKAIWKLPWNISTAENHWTETFDLYNLFGHNLLNSPVELLKNGVQWYCRAKNIFSDRKAIYLSVVNPGLLFLKEMDSMGVVCIRRLHLTHLPGTECVHRQLAVCHYGPCSWGAKAS